VEQSHRTALENGVPTLYHYEKFNARYLTTTLRDKIIHCSNPSNLNDPWDCKPAFDPHSLDNPEVLEREIAWRPEHPAKHLWAEQMRNQSQARVDFIVGASKSVGQMLAQRRIYCLTPRADSTLMWSHYADYHRGICLEFSVANRLFSRAREVVYREEYPRWVPCGINDEPSRVMELILTKSSDWSYEKEYRLVSIDAPASSSFLQLHGDFFRLPNGALRSVIIGCEADRQTIGTLIRQWSPELQIKKAVRSPNLYKLEIVDYLPD
jgi:Protein of unknown function (DUF2971)